MAEDRHESYCPKCHVRCEALMDLRTGQAIVTLPKSCPTRAECEQRMLPGFNPAPSGVGQ
jgi:hypothetical protein